MLILSLVSWWYTRGWLKTLTRLKEKVALVWDAFSVNLLFRTLFKPWHMITADVASETGVAGGANKLIGNFISRFVGGWVRIFTILAALLMAAVVSIVSLSVVVAWPLIPLSIIWLIFKGLGL